MEDDSISNAGSAISNVNKNRILYIRRTVCIILLFDLLIRNNIYIYLIILLIYLK